MLDLLLYFCGRQSMHGRRKWPSSRERAFCECVQQFILRYLQLSTSYSVHKSIRDRLVGRGDSEWGWDASPAAFTPWRSSNGSGGDAREMLTAQHSSSQSPEAWLARPHHLQRSSSSRLKSLLPWKDDGQGAAVYSLLRRRRMRHRVEWCRAWVYWEMKL